jgi:quercetin dioxygenase-like cupin family protein
MRIAGSNRRGWSIESTTVLIAGVAFFATLGAARIVHAAYANYALIIDPDASNGVQINLPAAAEYEEDVSVTNSTRSPSVYVFQDLVMDPLANTGWHIHPGLVLITVADGTVDWYDSHCAKQTRKAGDFFTESDQLHFVRNTSSMPARLILTFVIAKGETNKIYRPAPPCAAALGLDVARFPALK